MRNHINNKKEYRTITNFSQWEVNEDNVRHIKTKEVRPIVLVKGAEKVRVKDDNGTWRTLNFKTVFNMAFPPDLSNFKPKMGYEEFYLLNETGDIYSTKSFMFMKQCENQYGHRFVRLMDSVGKPVIYQHHAVWEYYNNELTKGWDIDHIDNNPRNNDIANLRKCTRRENIQRAAQEGRIVHGEKHHKTKNTNQEIWEIKVLANHFTITNAQLGKLYNLSPFTISNIKTDKTWKHISIKDVDPDTLDLSTFTIYKSGKLNGTVLFMNS